MKFFTAVLFLVTCGILGGCAKENLHLVIAPQLMSEIAAAEKRPIQLSDGEMKDVLDVLKGSRGRGAKAFSDPELRAEAFASFFRSPLTREVDHDRMIIVRYTDEGAFAFVGFGRDGEFFTDGGGQLYSDPPWSQ